MISKEAYMEEVNNKYITRKPHPSNPALVILNYTENATFDQRWNELTLACRGLIVDELSGEILARPFPKFFNYGEIPDLEIDIPFEESPEITVKYDGSLGISYKYNGKTCWATRGSFESVQAKAASTIWELKYKHVRIPDEITLLVEIIHPITKVVVDYNDTSDLIIIGAINRFTGYDYPYHELLELGTLLGMNVTQKVQLTLNEVIRNKETIDHNNEGWVLRWSNGKRLKIKGVKYLEIHKIAYGLSTKLKTEYWKDGKISELIFKIPEEFRKEIESLVAHLDEKADELLAIVNENKMNALNRTTDRKSFAIFVSQNISPSIRYLVFKSYDNRLTHTELKEHIFKNYLEYT
ncbi:RNA ligase [Cytobacillus purgationiresistens]|uniref:RNA ligase n=1 Tax=Cytobacillus purgationiresistens TaxID=863449 RepID=A0ABU0AA92_9BACI|nr:RNA ligase [Cytobacillus purgationiresistens]MDQ0268166.1 RNA ligase [Cytobacillus purgationiresistens]